MPEQKIWGTDECIFKGNCVEVHVLKLRPHEGKPTCCSWHKHEYKHNSFRVLEGRITIVWQPHGMCEAHKRPADEPIAHTPDGPTIGVTDPIRTTQILNVEDHVSIAPGRWHRLEVTEPATVIEVVWGTSLAEDIERADVGHVLEAK